MRIALILAGNLYMAPYVRYYTRILDNCGIGYDIIAWNRFGVDEAGVIALDLPASLHRGMIGKLMDYFRYRRFIQSRLSQVHYDKVIVFNIFNALMLAGLLKTRYPRSYIIDIRDHTPAVKAFPRRLLSVLKNAAMAVVSSYGYKRWLPDNIAYVVCHNTITAQPLPSAASPAGQSPCKILTIGAIGYFDANRAMIESLAGDPMFELEFVGSGFAEEMLKDFVAGRGIKNTHFAGRYAKEDEPKFLQGAALISILMDDSLNSKTLMSNRFYLSLIYGIPMMVDDNTEQARWVKQYNLGVIIDKQVDIKQQIMQYLRMYDSEKFDAGRKACLEIIRQDMVDFESTFREFLND